MLSSSVSSIVNSRLRVCSILASLIMMLIYFTLGFWSALVIFFFVAGISLPTLTVQYFSDTSFASVKQLGSGAETDSPVSGQDFREPNIQRCTICNLSNCDRLLNLEPKYLEDHEVWMTVEVNEQLNDAIAEFLDNLMVSFVSSWYSRLSKDVEFLVEVRRCIRHASAHIISRLRRIDFPDFLTTQIIPVFIRHIDQYDASNAIGSELLSPFFNKLLVQNDGKTYRERILRSELHMTLFSRCTELNYARRLFDHLLCETDLLPPHSRTSEASLIILRELLAVTVFVPVVDALAQPHFVTMCLSKLLGVAQVTNNVKCAVNVCTRQASHGVNRPVYAEGERRLVCFLERFVPHAGVGKRKRLVDIHSMTIDQLADSQERLFEFMQFVKRAGAVRFLQLSLSLDELNRELFGGALSDGTVRFRKFRDDLSDIVALANETEVRIALESTLALEKRLNQSGNRNRADSDEASNFFGYSMQVSEREVKESNMLSSNCTYEQLVCELERVSKGSASDMRSLLKSFCTLRLFGLVHTFLEVSCLREFNTDELRYRRCFDEPLYLSVRFDVADCYSNTLSVRNNSTRRRPSGNSAGETARKFNSGSSKRNSESRSQNKLEAEVRSLQSARRGSEDALSNGQGANDAESGLGAFADESDSFDDRPELSGTQVAQSALFDCQLGLPNLSSVVVSITCIEQRPIPTRVSSVANSEPFELVSFFVVDVECKNNGARWRTARRHVDFYQLEDKLRSFHGAALSLDSLPSRDLVIETLNRNRSAEQQLIDGMQFLDFLRPAFERFLRSAVSARLIQHSQLLAQFLSDSELPVPKARADKKRLAAPSESFLLVLAKSVERPPAKPNFRRYDAQNSVSFERRVLNNSAFRHSNWNDRFELDIMPSLTETSEHEAAIADILDRAQETATLVSEIPITTSDRETDESDRNQRVCVCHAKAFDYFGAILVIASRCLIFRPFVIRVFKGLYHFDALLSRTSVVRCLIRILFPSVSALNPCTLVNAIIHRCLCKKLKQAVSNKRLVQLLRVLTDAVFTKGSTSAPSDTQNADLTQSTTGNSQLEDVVQPLLASYSRMPVVVRMLLDKRCFDNAVRRLVATLQDAHLNKLFVNEAVDCILLAVFPELKTDRC